MVYCMKKATIEMGNIIKKMSNHVPESFLGYYILLATLMTIMTLYNGAAVQAVFFFPFGYVRHLIFS